MTTIREERHVKVSFSFQNGTKLNINICLNYIEELKKKILYLKCMNEFRSILNSFLGSEFFCSVVYTVVVYWRQKGELLLLRGFVGGVYALFSGHRKCGWTVLRVWTQLQRWHPGSCQHFLCPPWTLRKGHANKQKINQKNGIFHLKTLPGGSQILWSQRHDKFWFKAVVPN